MQAADKLEFQALLADAMAFYRRDLSAFALSVWWQACERFEFEQVAKAITAHAMDPEHGKFPPVPADVVRQLQGTNTDRSLIAWGKALDAMQRVGGYASVAFDDGVIHAVIEDMGGWPNVCASSTDELPFVQRRFCEAYRAYANRGDVRHPSRLVGRNEIANNTRGYAAEPPVLIGDPKRAQAVIANGVAGPKTQFTQLGQALSVPRIEGRAA